ncbi:hypothetical protein BCR37DRAFT_389178 [Protomyces lactucae-debilis]|uniref:Uncharacterized protein n=1 Tax=Protomyces lactucae-debilis TaxID=2754530 RepID=A0A1Y2F0J5_PROLT|nr:uncharacterized protein BCR37DRAFT_389178 [Protomyces lactucae-debilis]ORY77369.1 hypothetical protein BCR37DRAFT_389178 [Protomyces lactucae-debilis]
MHAQSNIWHTLYVLLTPYVLQGAMRLCSAQKFTGLLHSTVLQAHTVPITIAMLHFIILAAYTLASLGISNVVLGVKTSASSSSTHQNSLLHSAPAAEHKLHDGSQYKLPLSILPMTYKSACMCYNASLSLVKAQSLRINNDEGSNTESSTASAAANQDCPTFCTKQTNGFAAHLVLDYYTYSGNQACIRSNHFRTMHKSYNDHPEGLFCTAPDCPYVGLGHTCICEMVIGFDSITMPMKKVKGGKRYQIHPAAPQTDLDHFKIKADTLKCSIEEIKKKFERFGWQVKEHKVLEVMIPCAKEVVLPEGCLCTKEDIRNNKLECPKHPLEAYPTCQVSSSALRGVTNRVVSEHIDQEWISQQWRLGNSENLQNLFNSWQVHCNTDPEWPDAYEPEEMQGYGCPI